MLPWAGALGLFLLLLLWGAWAQLWQGAGARGSGLQLVCKPSALATHLETCCQSLRGFWAAPWAWRALPSLQSLASLAGPADSRVHFVRNHLQLHDQGLVALDWVVGPGPQPRRRVSGAGGAPVLLLVPNSFGKITRNVSKVRAQGRPAPCALGLPWHQLAGGPRAGCAPLHLHRADRDAGFWLQPGGW